MPRLRPPLLRSAHATHPMLPSLLRTCRDLPSAINEFRWLTEHAESKVLRSNCGERRAREERDGLLEGLCRKRRRGVPLQYLLGTEYFGDLELRCREGVLIPRPETATIVSHLISILKSRGLKQEFGSTLRVLDLCTGSGCIPLLFEHELRAAAKSADVQLQVLGVDISPHAISLAKKNLDHVRGIKSSRENPDPSTHSPVVFERADIMRDADILSKQRAWDIIISNPPYISRADYTFKLDRSVRHFEPRLALVPSLTTKPISNSWLQELVASIPSSALDGLEPEDAFYPRIAHIARISGAKALLVEVGDMAQARRVAGMCRGQGLGRVEVWKDELRHDGGAVDDGSGIVVRGSGEGRAVFCSRF